MQPKPCKVCGVMFKGQREWSAFCSRQCSNASRGRPLEVRFWEKVDKCGPTLMPELGPCWTWTGARNSGGYGHVKVDRKVRNAHMVAYCITNNVPFLEGRAVCVLHKCDGGALGCVNPAHLFLGTQQENVRDMVAKGRQQRGERSGQAKLCPCAVRAVRRLYEEGLLMREIAPRFGVGIGAVGSVLRGEHWSHVA